MNKTLLFALLLFMLPPLELFMLPPLAHAGEAVPTAEDPVLEKRVMEVSHNLRCLVCQNQTIADSNAELAVDLRNQVREKLQQGESEREILEYMVSRYGEFVLFKPLVKSTTWLLWFGPLLLVVLGIGVLIVMLRQRRTLMQQAQVMSAEERVRAASLLSGINKRSRS